MSGIEQEHNEEGNTSFFNTKAMLEIVGSLPG